jgi:hypothetical protein
MTFRTIGRFFNIESFLSTFTNSFNNYKTLQTLDEREIKFYIQLTNSFEIFISHIREESIFKTSVLRRYSKRTNHCVTQ